MPGSRGPGKVPSVFEVRIHGRGGQGVVTGGLSSGPSSA
jgi:hypothetical protein